MLPAPFDQLTATSQNSRVVTEGEHLFLQGDVARAIYFVQRGEIRLVRHGEAGTLVPVFRALSGDTFAEAALFSPVYHCDAVASRPSTVISLNKPVILSVMERDPSFALALTKRFAGQVQAYRRRLEIQAIASAHDRVLAALSDGWLTGTVVDFAAEIGLSHEATFRALSRLVQDGRAVRPARGCYQVVQG